jgi:hypothetical protein
MKMGRDALGTAQNMSGSAKPENGTRRPRYRPIRVRDPAPSVTPKKSPGAENMTTGPDALVTDKNVFVSAKHENGTRRPRYRQKRFRERKT